MTLLYALGLLGLIGIPVLILIYIIKNKYTEQTVSSTYLWRLSEKFLKRRLPINRLVGIISLILQILAVILVSILIAHPVIILHDSAYAYCYVLDGSGSMNIVQNGETRFEAGKRAIKNMIEDAADGSTYTLIYAGNTSETIFKDITDKDRAISTLESLDVTYISPEIVPLLDVTQEYFDGNNYAHIYYVTDKNYEKIKNVEIVNVAEGAPIAENYAVTGVEYEFSGTELTVTGKIISYHSEDTVNVRLSMGRNIAGRQIFRTTEEKEVEVPAAGEETYGEAEFSFVTSATDFQSFKVELTGDDDLPLDDEIIINNVKYENIAQTLIVSDGEFFITAPMAAAGNTNYTVVTSEEYAENPAEGYGLYVFDTYVPAELPSDGAVWFINPQGSVKGSNFAYQGVGTARESAKYSTTTSLAEKLASGTSGRDFEIYRYSKCSLSGGGKFTTIARCDNNPVIFAGSNMYGNREVVFAFSLHDSAPFTLSADCAVLFSNFINYSFPSVIENTAYYCGEQLQVNVVAGCETLRVITPAGTEVFLDASSTVSEYQLPEVGAYKIIMTFENGTEQRTFNIFASLPEEERVPYVTDYDFTISGIALDGKFDGVYDNLLIIFILLAVIAVADYGVYCYEQYQLR